MSYRLEISDDRDDDTMEAQLKAFKEELVQEIEFGREDNTIEDNLVEWINTNRIHQSISINEHKRDLKYPITDLDIYAVPESATVDLVEHSKKYKYLLFKLSYTPKNPYDAWVRYFKDGKVQISKLKIVIDKFDESKLK